MNWRCVHVVHTDVAFCRNCLNSYDGEQEDNKGLGVHNEGGRKAEKEALGLSGRKSFKGLCPSRVVKVNEGQRSKGPPLILRLLGTKYRQPEKEH